MLPSSLARSSGREGNSLGPCARPLGPCSPGEQGEELTSYKPWPAWGPHRHFTLGGLELTCVHQAIAFCSVGLQPATVCLQTGSVGAAAVPCPGGGGVTHQGALEEAGMWE